MCLEFDFQAKCQLFHAETPSGFGPGPLLSRPGSFNTSTTCQLEQILEFWPPLLSHVLSHRLPPVALGGLDCKVPEDVAGADPPYQGSTSFSMGQEPSQRWANFLFAKKNKNKNKMPFLRVILSFSCSYQEILDSSKL